MIVSESKTSSESVGMGETTAFSMNLDGMMFDNLINGIYADKIAAPIRELSTNARDGHVRRGNLDTPFEIKLPTRLDQEFSVRDYGSSLTHEEIMEMYTVLGTSTKRDTNDETGCLGLGSKSPFAYTSAFTVTCWLDGMERTYSAYITTSGIPNMSLVFEEKSEEPQGVKVAFAVKDEDIEKFHKSAGTVLLGFDPEPIVTPRSFKLASREIALEGKGWKITTENMNSVIVQGSVSYPIDVNNVELVAAIDKQWKTENSYYNYRPNSFGRRSIENSLIMNVDIGSVDVVTSRESLQYTERTITSIINGLKVIQSEIEEKITDQISKSKSYREAVKKYSELYNGNNAISRIMKCDKETFFIEKFKYDNKKLCNVLNLYDYDAMIMERGWGWDKVKTLKASYKRNMKNSDKYIKQNEKYGAYKTFGELDNKKYTIVVQSLEQDYSVHMRMRAFWEKTEHTYGYIWIVTETDKEAEEIQEKAYLKDNEIFLLHKLEDVKMPKRVSTTKDKEIRLRVLKPFTERWWSWSDRSASYGFCDVKNKFIYVEQEGGRYLLKGHDYSIEEISKLLGSISKTIDSMPTVFTIPKSRKKIMKNKTAMKLEDYLNEELTDRKIKKWAKEFPFENDNQEIKNLSNMLDNFSGTLPKELQSIVNMYDANNKSKLSSKEIEKCDAINELLYSFDEDKYKLFKEKRKQGKVIKTPTDSPILLEIASNYYYRSSGDLDEIINEYIELKGYK